jgi:small subunit ribosomal protein S17
MTTTETTTVAKTGGKVLRGTVVKSAMKDTVTVAVMRYVKDVKYKKFVKRVKKYLVHNPGNTAEVGTMVNIKETRPISKNKNFVVISE